MRRGEATFSASGAASSALSPHAGKLNCPKIDYCGLSLEQTQFPSPTKDSQSNSQISDSQVHNTSPYNIHPHQDSSVPLFYNK
ncbi:hypothetical protein ACSS6W_007100 [Trichoderma asperelloides]